MWRDRGRQCFGVCTHLSAVPGDHGAKRSAFAAQPIQPCRGRCLGGMLPKFGPAMPLRDAINPSEPAAERFRQSVRSRLLNDSMRPLLHGVLGGI
jgi:hypothetical protein